MSTSSPFAQPVTLRGRHVLLEPLSPGHHDALVDAVHDGELWKYGWPTNGTLRDTVVFSIIEAEWPAVKAHHGFKLAGR